MLIVCPACSSRYELDDAKIGPGGRKVRCAPCQNAWQVEPPRQIEPDPAPESLADADAPEFPSAPSQDETSAMLAEELRHAAEIEESVSILAAEQNETAGPTPGKAGKPPARRKAKWMPVVPKAPFRLQAGATSLFALIGLALLGLALWQREPVVRAMPQLAALYEKLGLPVNVRGLAFSAVESELVQDGQGRFLIVEGDVTNIARHKTTMPPITVAVKDEKGQVLYTWTAEPPRPALEPAELVRFRARLAAPPEAGRSVQVRFGAGASAAIASSAH